MVVGRLGWAAAPARLRVAVGVALLGALLTAVAVLAGLVAGQPDPGFASGPLLVVLAVAPVAAAALFIQFGRAPVGAGVLTGAALLAPGLALVDAQLLLDALRASRPELLVPTSLAPLPPTAGAWLLLAGHLATLAAGILAAGKAGARSDSDYRALLDQTISVAARGRAMGWALACATVTVAGILLPPFRSDNAFLVGNDLVASPLLVLLGGLLIALTLVIGGVLAAGSARPPLARGMVLGILLALAWLSLPQLVAIATLDWLHLERGGPLLALIPLCLLVAILFGRDTDRKELAEGELPPDLQLESSPLHLVTGVLGVLTGVAALVAGLGDLVVVEGGDAQPDSYANRQLIPAGVLLVVLGAALFTRWAGLVRPAFVVSLGSVALVGLASLDAAFTGTTVSGQVAGLPAVTTELRVGAAVWFAVAAIVLAAFAAVSAAVAGGAERDDVDLTERSVHRRIAIPLGAAVLLAVGAFGFPMTSAPEFVAPGIWTEFRLASWGLLVGLAVVVGAVAVASMARPARAAALLLGAATVVGVHLLELPLTGDRVAGASAGPGTWLSLACVAALVVAAVLAATGRAKGRAKGRASDEPAE